MAYGSVKVDTIIFDDNGSDQNVTVSGLYRATTSGVTVSGTIAAGTVSGVTVIGSTTVSGATVTGTTANFTSGNFSNIISAAATMSGALIMANQQQVQFREAVGNGVNHIALQAPAIVSADQTITLPDETGTVVTTGDTGSVTSTMILDGTIVNDDISASAAIVDTKLDTISTAGKVSGTAITSGAIETTGSFGITNGAPTIRLTESGGTATHSQTALARNNDKFLLQTRDSTGTTTLSNDYIIPANASGATEHQWRIADTEKLNLNSTGLTVVDDLTIGDKIIHAGDIDTAIRFPAADTVSVETDGSEGVRITSTGAVLVGATAAPTDVANGDIALQNRLVMNASASNYGQFQRIADVGTNITATTGTIVFKFKTSSSGSHRSAFVKINLSGRCNNGTPSNSPACEYAFQLHQTSAGVCSINGTTTIFQYTFVRATHFAFANLGSGECTVTLTNPVALSIIPAYMVEINTQLGTFGLDAVTIT
jgi:trimeric autotransporter adhesin